MKHKNEFWLSLIFAICVAGTPVGAYAAKQTAPPPPENAQQTPPHLDPDQRDAQRTVPGAYRLTYTLTDMDGSRKVGSQHFAILLDANAKATLRLGTRVPIATGVPRPDAPAPISYVDIGLGIDSRLRQFANGLELSTHVDQSSLDAQQSNTKDPIIREISLDSSVLLHEDKPVLLGTLDIPESTHRLEIQVELTKLP